MIDDPRDRPAHAAVEPRPGSGSMQSNEWNGRKDSLLRREYPFGRNRFDGGVIRGNKHNVSRRNLRVQDVQRTRAPLLHVKLKTPMALKPDRAELIAKSCAKDVGGFKCGPSLAIIGDS